MPAFQPYRGKPAVRNDGEGRGNVGIIRSPVRASTLPDINGIWYKLPHCSGSSGTCGVTVHAVELRPRGTQQKFGCLKNPTAIASWHCRSVELSCTCCCEAIFA